jgi:hypothetical protein
MEADDRTSSEAPDVVSLGIFAGGALLFVRELLHDQAIASREEPLVAPNGAPRSEIWVGELDHARATGLLEQSQVEAEAAAHREALGASSDADAHDSQAAAPRDGHAHVRHAKTRRELRAARPKKPHADADAFARRLGIAVATLLLVFAGIFAIGERYGTYAPVGGHNGRTIACTRWQVICF